MLCFSGFELNSRWVPLMAGSLIFSTFRCTFLNRHMIVWFSWIISICEIYGEYGTADHLEPV